MDAKAQCESCRARTLSYECQVQSCHHKFETIFPNPFVGCQRESCRIDDCIIRFAASRTAICAVPLFGSHRLTGMRKTTAEYPIVNPIYRHHMFALDKLRAGKPTVHNLGGRSALVMLRLESMTGARMVYHTKVDMLYIFHHTAITHTLFRGKMTGNMTSRRIQLLLGARPVVGLRLR